MKEGIVVKKIYAKPVIRIELYQLEANLASCVDKVSWGPDADLNEYYGYGNSVCKEYKDAFEVAAASDSSGYYQNFYVGSCSCYLSSGETLVSS